MKPCYQIIILSSCLLAGCASQSVDYGIVLSEKLVKETDRTEETTTGAKVGAVVGTAVGTISAAATGAACSIVTFGACAPAIPTMVVAGAAAGGTIGSTSGAALGYGFGTYRQKKGFFEYSVYPCQINQAGETAPLTTDLITTAPLKIQQHSATLLPSGTPVHIERGSGKSNTLTIRPLKEKELKNISFGPCLEKAESIKSSEPALSVIQSPESNTDD